LFDNVSRPFRLPDNPARQRSITRSVMSSIRIDPNAGSKWALSWER
jgi:hypothetical protein